MEDIYLYLRGGGAFPELLVGLRRNKRNFKRRGYNVYIVPPMNLRVYLPPKNSNVVVMGDWKFLHGLEDKMKKIGCNIAFYLMEPLPSLLYDGTLYLGAGHYSDKATTDFESKIDRYSYLVFTDGSVENFVLSRNKDFEGRTCTNFIGVDQSYIFRRENARPKYDFMHFGWCPFGSRRSIRLERTGRKFSVYPKWEIVADERTLAFNSSRYILAFYYYNQPCWQWIRFMFSVANKMPLFTEASYCEPLYTKTGNPSIIESGKHLIEFPYIEGQGDYGEIYDILHDWLDHPDKLKRMADDNYKYFFKNYPFRKTLPKLFDKIFM